MKYDVCTDCQGSGIIMTEYIRIGTRCVPDVNGELIQIPTPEVDYEPSPCEKCAGTGFIEPLNINL